MRAPGRVDNALLGGPFFSDHGGGLFDDHLHELFDRLLSRLSGAELKALLYITRRTFGFKRDSDSISFSQFVSGITTRDGRVLDEGCGIKSRSTLSRSLASLEEKGIIETEKRLDEKGDPQVTVYRLRFAGHGTRVVRKSYHPSPIIEPGGSSGNEPGVVPESNLQQTGLQQTVEQATEQHVEYSNIRKVSTAEGGRPSPSTSNPSQAVEGVEAVGEILGRTSRAGRRSKPRPETLDEDYQRIQDCIEDRAREFNDTASLKSSTTRAYRLYKRSGIPIEAFIDRVFQARSLTQERTAAITKTAKDPSYGVSRKTKMAYFFAVLEDQLGLAEPRAPDDGSKGDDDAGSGDDDPYARFVQH